MAAWAIAFVFVGGLGDVAGGVIEQCKAQQRTDGADADLGSLLQMPAAAPEHPVADVSEVGSAGTGRTVTVAASSDGSICGIGDFTRYPMYFGALKVSGKMWMSTYGNFNTSTTTQLLTFRLTGVDSNCRRGPGLLPNSCSIQIHEGTSCSAPTGAPYWNSAVLHKSPWGGVSYASFVENAVETAGAVDLPVRAGLMDFEIRGRTVVVHDFLGGRVACAPIMGYGSGLVPRLGVMEALQVTMFQPYYTYTGSYRVTGTVTLYKKPGPTEATTGLYLGYRLNGVDTECNMGPGTAPNSCGIRVHAGSSCDKPAGMRLFNIGKLLADPWVNTYYTSTPGWFAVTAMMHKDPVHTGLKPEDLRGHALLVFDSQGQAMACGIIY